MRRRGGFSLLEMLVALSLAALVILGMSAMFAPALGTQNALVRGLRSQGDALLALKALGGDLSQASEVSMPGKIVGGSQGSTLSGCINYDSNKGAAIDTARPVVGFRYCLVNGTLYRGTAARCPTRPPDCGAGSLALASNITPAPGFTGFFSRPAGAGNVVELHYVVTSGDQSQEIDTAYQFQGAP